MEARSCGSCVPLGTFCFCALEVVHEWEPSQLQGPAGSPDSWPGVSKEVRCLPLVSLTVELSPGGRWGWWGELILGHLGTFFPSEWYKNQGVWLEVNRKGQEREGRPEGFTGRSAVVFKGKADSAAE